MKKIIAAAAIAFTTLSTFAGVMNWQVADTSNGQGGYYDAARLVARNGSDEVTVADKDGYYFQNASGGSVGMTQTADLSSLSGYTFYVEMGAYSGTNPTSSDLSAWTAQVTTTVGSYNDLINAGIISSAMSAGGGGLPNQTFNPSASSFSPVPEPGTATLILLGMAIAGLKRRRV